MLCMQGFFGLRLGVSRVISYAVIISHPIWLDGFGQFSCATARRINMKLRTAEGEEFLVKM